MIFQFIAIASVIFSNDPTIMLTLFPVLMVFFVALFFGWFYTLGTSLHKKLPTEAPMNLARFKFFLLIPVAYMIFLPLYMFGLFTDTSQGNQPGLFDFAVILPLHLFSMFCIFYCLYFNAKALKSVELNKAVTFSDFAGEFFLIWFFPIGIWIIQPRINKLFDQTVND